MLRGKALPRGCNHQSDDRPPALSAGVEVKIEAGDQLLNAIGGDENLRRAIAVTLPKQREHAEERGTQKEKMHEWFAQKFHVLSIP